MALDLSADAELPCSLQRAGAELERLDAYPAWLGIVLAASPAEAVESDGGPAWWVELGGKVGLVRRAKRVRMVRTERSERLIRFERSEVDGRVHNRWVLEAHLTPTAPQQTGLKMAVHYSGERRIPLLDAVLRSEVRRAGRRLVDRVAGLR